jgi:hypothetical protein
MRDDELEEELRPAGTVDLARPRWQRVPHDVPNQRPFAEGAIHDHGDATLAGDRKDALLDLAIEDVVRDLHEVERLRAEELLHLRVTASF